MTALQTPDRRYIVVNGRLWRAANPNLPEPERNRLVKELMEARRQVKSPDPDAKAQARRDVDRAKHALGERGPVWWDDGAPDHNRRMVKNTPYAAWFKATALSMNPDITGGTAGCPARSGSSPED
ncbi:hypothetical protein ABIB57_000929 [Devosia sp. UYZn731]|uniref:hypothetical protein n=1 Tax=Devosia sp. UYZn731 TaxID=3156345 RepID=UPI003390B837